jgi:tetratricopeptide (TPR) repeat protein
MKTTSAILPAILAIALTSTVIAAPAIHKAPKAPKGSDAPQKLSPTKSQYPVRRILTDTNGRKLDVTITGKSSTAINCRIGNNKVVNIKLDTVVNIKLDTLSAPDLQFLADLDADPEYGRMCYDAGQQNEAVRFQQQLLGLLRERDGDGASSTINCEDELLEFLFRAGTGMPPDPDYLKVLNQAFERRTKSLGQESPSTLSLESDLALLLFSSGDINKALVHAEHSVPLLRKACGNKDGRTLNAISNLARCYTAVGRSKEAIELLQECCPQMSGDTFVNFLLAQLDLWYGLREDYNTTRRWMLDFAVGIRDRLTSRPDILERVVYIACLAPLENDAQAVEINKTLARAESIRTDSGAKMDLGHGGDMRNLIAGMILIRTGQPDKAIPHFDKALELIKTARDDWRAWDRCTVAYYKAMALQQMGQAAEARALFDATDKKMVRWESDDQPLRGNWAPSGERMTHWLAYKEAKTLIEQAIPAVEK